MTPARSVRTLVAAIATAATVAACGSSGHGHSATSGAAAGPTVAAGAFNASAVYGRDAGGVVTVISVFRSAPGSAGETLQGSGFVISPGGQLVTNAHVVTVTTGAVTRRASAVYVQFSDGNQVPARIVGADPNADVALLAIDPTGLHLTPLALGTSASLAVGAPVAALGSPFGQAGSMSVGVISATNRSIQSLNGTNAQNSFSIPGAIQTDAAINHGNSGGPLVNARGAVIGINSQIASSSGGGQGVGFAVPVDAVERSVAQLRAHGSVAYAYIGVSSIDLFPQLGRRLHLGVTHGAFIQSVAPGGPAARAGLRGGSTKLQFDAAQYATGGDVITKLNGRALTLGYSITDAVAPLSPGQTVTLEVWRGGAPRQVKVTLGTRPAGGEG
jgi:S1-C subfamily serine protease